MNMKLMTLLYAIVLCGRFPSAAASHTPLTGVWRPVVAVDEQKVRLTHISYEIGNDGVLTYTDGSGTALRMEMKHESEREFSLRAMDEASSPESVRIADDGKELIRILMPPGGKQQMYQYVRSSAANKEGNAHPIEGRWLLKAEAEKRTPEELTITEENGSLRLASATQNILIRSDGKGIDVRPEGNDRRSVRVSGRRTGERGLELTVKRGGEMLVKLEFEVAGGDGRVMIMKTKYFNHTGATREEKIQYERKLP